MTAERAPRSVVTGGCGFVGSHVVRRLLDAGHDVTVVDRRLSQAWPGASYRRADILREDQLADAFAGADYIFHLAAHADVDEITDAPSAAVEANVTGTARVLDAARVVGARRIVLASTVWVYGAAAEGDASADPGLYPQSVSHVYTATKIAAEMLVTSYARMYGVEYTILRYGIPYGPGMRDALVMARFVRQALDGRPLTISGDGSQIRYYVYVEDLADAHLLALGERAANEIIALEGAEPVSIAAIAEAVRRLVGEVRIEHQPARSGDYQARRIAPEKAERLLGWRPATPLEDGLARYLDWLGSGERQPAGPPA